MIKIINKENLFLQKVVNEYYNQIKLYKPDVSKNQIRKILFRKIKDKDLIYYNNYTGKKNYFTMSYYLDLIIRKHPIVCINGRLLKQH